MEKLKMCRICLVENVSMYEVANKDLQKMYEKLADIPFVTGDFRPILTCFFCYTKLKQSYQLHRKCLKAEEVFAQMLIRDYEHIPIEFQGEIEFCGGLATSEIQLMSTDDVYQEVEVEVAIPEQRPAVCEEDDAEIKEEYLILEPEAVYLEDSYLDQGDLPSHHSASDSESEVPMKKFKIELEEIGALETRARVVKKPELDIREAKQEVTIIGKQKRKRLSDPNIATIVTSETVPKFRDPIMSDTIPKPEVNNSIINNDKEITNESINEENVKEVINIAIDTKFRNLRNIYHFGYKILKDKSIKSDAVNMHKKIGKMYKCDICQRSFSSKPHLNRHMLIHSGEKPYKCDICQRGFTQTHHLNRHIQTHSEKPYKCHICPRSFTLKSHLNLHIQTHSSKKPYKCDICHRGFNQKHTLNSHMIIHTGVKPYECVMCQRSFYSKISLKNHILMHTGEKPYMCDVCPRVFAQKSNLNKHIRIHTGEKPYKCDICQRCFTQKCQLDAHVLSHTGEKPYKCDICQHRFGLKKNLTRHILIHTGEKPYQCDICPRSFNQKNTLNYHIRIHTGEKPYECVLCQRSFKEKKTLNNHILTHTGENPYKCDICQRSFNHKRALINHNEIHTGKKPYTTEKPY